MEKKVLLTIDTEGHKGKDPVDKLIFGHTKDGYFGIVKIINQLDKYGVKGLFFVDFAECWDYGEEKIQKVIDQILDHGHDVGVHIHPDHMGDRNKLFLYEYTYDEQYEMIQKCTSMYRKMVGKHPKSFRAGKYSANRDTLKILQELGYKYDFSEFYHQKWCGISPPITINAPVKYGSIVEFPVTMHKSFSIGPIVREDKVDIEGMTMGELKYSLSQIKMQTFDMVAILFLHSFSMLKWREFPDNPQKDVMNIEKFESAIQYVQNDSMLEFISEKDLEDITPQDLAEGMKSEIQWKSKIRGIFYTYLKAKKIYKRNRKAKFLVYMVRSGLIVMLLLISYICIR